MTIEQVKYYIDKIKNAPISDIDKDEFIQFTIKVIEDYNKKSFEQKPKGLILQEYFYLQIFFHKYACKLNDNEVEYEFVSTTEIDEINRQNPNNPQSYNDCYSFYTNKVRYVASGKHVFQDPTAWNMFHAIHENRHAKQNQFFSMGEKDVLQLDSLAIAIIKEYLAIGYGATNLYNTTNHRCFVMENDASLSADTIIRDFVSKYCPNNNKLLEDLNRVCHFEKNDYASMIHNQQSLVEFDFIKAEEGTLPVFYEIDRIVKQIIVTKELLEQFPILSFIYNQNGKPKSYQELMQNKERLKAQNIGDTSEVKNNSFTDYQQKTIPVSTHIENLYDVIIKTDPCLQIEHYLNHGKFYQIKDLLTTCPQLITQYKKNIFDIYYKYLTLDNYSKIYPLVTSLGNPDMITKIENRYNTIIIKSFETTFGIKITNIKSMETETLKTKQELDAEEVILYNQIEQKIQDKSLPEKIGREYQKAIHHIYNKYRKGINAQAYESPNKNNGSKEESQKTTTDFTEMIDFVDEDLLDDQRFLMMLNNYRHRLHSQEDVERIIDLYRSIVHAEKKSEEEIIEQTEQRIR